MKITVLWTQLRGYALRYFIENHFHCPERITRLMMYSIQLFEDNDNLQITPFKTLLYQH